LNHRPAATTNADSGLRSHARRIWQLAWPVFVGQLSVLGFSTVDTLLMARSDPVELAALAVGAAAYITIFIGFMGVVMAVSPIVGQLYGASEHAQAGRQAWQAVWIALGLSVIGSLLLIFPQPFLALAHASPEVAERVRGYLLALAFSLPASLLFTVFRGFNVAISQPRAVMRLQVTGLAIKIPLSAALALGVPALGLAPMGVAGCGIATAVAMWSQWLLAVFKLRTDARYNPFRLWSGGFPRPDRSALWTHLQLGIPMGLAVLVEVTAFSFMAIFIARLGATAVAGHQIVANLVALLFMMPLAIGQATGTLVAQRVGARDLDEARRLGWHGLLIAGALSLLAGASVRAAAGPIVAVYTHDSAVAAVAAGLVAWIVWFHPADALQAVAAFILRSYRVARMPLLILAISLWGVGLGGGYWLAFRATSEGSPLAALPRGADAFWAASTLSLMLAAAALTAFLAWWVRRLARPAG
jgi:MATE family multidrug resistance protein